MTVVSVIIPLYNGVEYLEECVRSVIAQTFTDWEVLIGINGHGYDGGEVATIAREIAALDSRIKVLIQPPPLKGKIESSHHLVIKSKADWICMLDCDDKWEPTKLERQIDASRTVAKNAAVIGSFCYYFGDLTGIVPVPAGLIHPSQLETSNPIVNSSAMIQREYCLWKDEDISGTMEDYSLWMNISLQGKDLYNVPELLTWHRIHTTSAFNSKHISNIPLRTRYSQLYKQMVLRSVAYGNTYDATISRINRFVNVERGTAITFIIPTSDQTKLLRTLRSILSQTKDDWRAIVVFYGCEPTDETVLSILQDPRFLYMSITRSDTHYVNGQLGYIRNIGLRFVSNSSWVGFIDEGDTIISTYCQRLEDEENYATSADAIIFKMKCGNDVFPPENYHQITQHLVGISFVIRSNLLREGYVFKPSSSEDFTFLFDLQRKFKTIAFSKIIAYYVKEDAPYSSQTDYTPRFMLHPK
jgi:glycosyltransferase involved in cell wall biosynthesis